MNDTDKVTTFETGKIIPGIDLQIRTARLRAILRVLEYIANQAQSPADMLTLAQAYALLRASS